MDKGKKQPSESTDEPQVSAEDDNLHLEYIFCLSDLADKAGQPLHSTQMTQELWLKKHVRKGQAKHIISKLVRKSWLIHDPGRGYFICDTLKHRIEERHRMMGEMSNWRKMLGKPWPERKPFDWSNLLGDKKEDSAPAPNENKAG